MLKEESCICILWTWRNDRVPWKVFECALRKKGKPEVLVRSVMSLYEGAKTRVIVDSELSEEVAVSVGMHQ